MRWIYLEPYFGGSHRHLAETLRDHLPLDAALWTLPARKWKWRMRAAAQHFADRWRRERPRVDAVFATDLLNAAELRGLLPAGDRGIPLVLYFHENQLTYPVRVEDERDYHYAWTNALSALAADRVLWNTATNRDGFLGALEGFLRRMPAPRPRDLPSRIRARSAVLPVPLSPDVEPLARGPLPRGPRPGGRRGPCRILWNHRWEHDKDPETFFAALVRLAGEGHAFEVVVLGESFRERPRVFDEARVALGKHIVGWGFQASREEYLHALEECDVAVSTARHEFQGLAVLEAAARGAVPLVPDDLAYPEIWPRTYRYPRGALVDALRDRILHAERWREEDPTAHAAPYAWSALEPRWRAVFAQGAPARRGG